MPQTRLFSPVGLQSLSFAAFAVFYCALTIWIYLTFPALAGALALIAGVIVVAGTLERTKPG
jgi:hypothetical protein